MSTTVDSPNRDINRPKVDRTSGQPDVRNDPAKAQLKEQVAKTPDSAADGVAKRVVANTDSVETKPTNIPPTEPNAANRAKADEFNSEMAAIRTRESDLKQQTEALAKGDYRTTNQMRHDVLGRIAEHAQGIKDPAERDRFVRAVAPEAGRTAGELARSGPAAAYQRLDAIGKGVSPDTGRLLANSALQTAGGRDGILPMGVSGTPVGNALSEERQGIAKRSAELLGNTARAVVPLVDAGTRLAQGDLEGAAASAALDVAGGAILKGGKLVAGAAVGALAMSPDQAQAGVFNRLTMRVGKESVEFQARKNLVKGRTPVYDVKVPGTFKDGTQGTLSLSDPRGKHNALGNLDSSNLTQVAKQLSKGKGPNEFKPALSAGQFTGPFNSAEGQAQLARLVMERVTPADLAKVGQKGGRLDVPLDRVVGLTPNGRGDVVTATSVRVMRNNDGSFHLVPMP